jgi:hypothetical protein
VRSQTSFLMPQHLYADSGVYLSPRHLGIGISVMAEATKEVDQRRSNRKGWARSAVAVEDQQEGERGGVHR